MTLMEFEIYSRVLQLSMPVTVLYPDYQGHFRADQKGESYPKRRVLWLYHGSSGDQTLWLRRTNAEEYLNRENLVTVMPMVHNSCYYDMGHGAKYASYVGQELPEIMRGLLPDLSDRRQDNYVAGYSNGGFGAFHIGLLYPEKYSAIGAFSAEDVGNGTKNKEMRDGPLYFGEIDPRETDNSIQYQARTIAAGDRPKPLVYHTVGAEEPYVRGNREVRDTFRSLPGDPFRYRYQEFPGWGHEWAMWDESLKIFLDLIRDPANLFG